MEFLLISCLAAKAHFVEAEAWYLGASARVRLGHSKQQDSCRRSCLESKSVSSKLSKKMPRYITCVIFMACITLTLLMADCRGVNYRHVVSLQIACQLQCRCYFSTSTNQQKNTKEKRPSSSPSHHYSHVFSPFLWNDPLIHPPSCIGFAESNGLKSGPSRY